MRIVYTGAPYSGPHIVGVDSMALFRLSGRNSGNLLIGTAIMRQLKISHIVDFNTPPEAAEKDCNHIVIGAANFLYPGFDFSYIADYLEKCRLPCTIIGLGAQAPQYGTVPDIPAGTRRMLDIISERSASLGVRGHNTAFVLEKMGIKNVTVTGCPSFYMSLSPTAVVKSKLPFKEARLAFNGSRDVIRHSSSPDEMRAIEHMIMSYAFFCDSTYILQTEIPELQIACKEGLSETDIRELKLFYPFASDSWKAFYEFLEKRLKVFFDYEKWSEEIRTHDFVMGSRIHGNLIAIINGIPAAVIAHDTRTREMCELLAIPHVVVGQMQPFSVEAVYEKATYDVFRLRYNTLFHNYREFLDANKLEHNLIWKPDLGPMGSLGATESQ